MWPIRCFCAVVVTVSIGLTAGWAYELTELGEAGGWDKINKGGSVTTVLVTSRYTGDVSSDVDGALRSAYKTWADVDPQDGLSFEFLPDGGNYDPDGGNYDAFDTYPPNLDQGSDWNYANIVMGGWLPLSYFTNLDPNNGANILAVTWTAKLRGGSGPRKPTWHSEIFFNDGWTWADNESAGIDIETVALHELGHAIGFGHGTVDDGVDSIMDPFYSGKQRTLFLDDIDGMTALYGTSGDDGGGGGKGKPPWAGGPKKLTNVTYAGDLGVVPEPSSFVLAVLGMLGLLAYGWRRRLAA